MKKTIHLLVLGVTLSTGAYAQSVEDGVKAYYNGNYDGAINILGKQQSNPVAAYYLAETYFDLQKNAEANAAVTAGLSAKPNDPLLLAAKGHYLLTEKKVAEATQSFEAAITAAGNKDDAKATVLNAVGHAASKVYNNIDKIGDIKYAVQKLEQAKAVELGIKEKSRNKMLLADILTNLGNAYRKANPGDGSLAFGAYQDAEAADPSFAEPILQKAFIFRSQRNAPSYLETLNKAVTANPAFVKGYEELYKYYAFGVKDSKQAQAYADKIIANSAPTPNIDYYKAQAYYFNKQYSEAINAGKSIITKAGKQTSAKVYKLIAYSLIENKDTAAAIPYVDDYFKNQAKDEIVPLDYTLKAVAYSTTPGKEGEIVKTFSEAVAAENDMAGKLEILETGAKTFADKGKNAIAGDLYSKILEVKPADKHTINDYFYAGYTGYYKAGQYDKAWKVFDAARTKFPKWNYGYRFAYASSKVFDSTNSQNKFISDGEKYLNFLQTTDTSDVTAKRAEVFKTAVDIAMFNYNVKKDNATAVKYLKIAHSSADDATAKQQVEGYIKSLGGSVGTSTSVNAGPAGAGVKTGVKVGTGATPPQK